jgi:hypothetical protein
MTVPVPFSQELPDIAQQSPADAVDRGVNLRPLSGRPGAVLPAGDVGRKKREPWKDPSEFRSACFASDQTDDLHAPVRQEFAEKSPDSGACRSHQHDDPRARVRGKGVVRRTDRCES